MVRLPTPLLLLCLVLGAARADAEPAERIELSGAPAVLVPPALPGQARTTAPGQWQITYTGEGAYYRMQARVFPVRDLKEPGPVLMQALDTLVRNNGFGAFGVTGRSTSEVYGRPVADAVIQVSVAGRVARGHARLLLVTPTQWAFAWGLVATPELSRGTLGAIRRFTTSLEPRDPSFYTPRFRDDAALEKVIVQKPGEEAVTGGHVRGVAALVEAGLGRRLPVATRESLESMLVLEARRGIPRTRTGYVASAEDVVRSMKLEPEARAARMRALGRRIVAAIEARAKEGYLPAVGAVRVWSHDAQVLAEAEDHALEAGHLEAEVELAGFLLSIARDQETSISRDLRDAHAKTLTEAWPKASAALRADRVKVGTLWARLRHAWDTARPAARNAFRVAVARALLPAPREDGAHPAPHPPEEGDLRGLKRWFAENRAVFDRPEAVAKALNMTAAERSGLIDTLGVDAAGYQFGW